MRILVVEEDVPLANFIRQQLEAELYELDLVRDVEAALAMRGGKHDLMLLDLGAANQGSLSPLQRLRAEHGMVLILVLAAPADVASRVECLDAGADDYMVKPFSLAELSARIRALMRRTHAAAEMVLRVGDLQLDRVERRVERGGRPIDLTAKEFSLLEYLILRAGQRVSRAMILGHVWNVSGDRTTNVVDVYINYLRQKIERGSDEHLIHTVRGVGYVVSCAERGSALSVAR